MYLSFAHKYSPIRVNPRAILSFSLVLLTVSANIMYAPPPAINFTEVVMLNQSSQESAFIGSKRLESLEITQSGGTTTFKLTYFNRSSPNNINQYEIFEHPGTWTYLKGTQETLSCNLIYDTTNQLFGLLFFQNYQGVFKILATMSRAKLQDYLPAYLQGQNYTVLAAGFIPGENCEAGLLFETLFYLPTPTEVTSVPLPTGWQDFSFTESFEYGIIKSKLYKLNKNTYQYDSIYALETSQTYRLKEYKGRIIISAANGTINSSNSNGLNQFFQKIFFFNYAPSGLLLIGTATFNGSTYSQGIIPIFTSPKLTKIGYSYIPPGSDASFQVFAKSVDYLNNKVVDMSFTDPEHAFKTFDGAQGYSFDFSDYFLVVRNGSAQNPVDAVEEAYQFMGNKIVRFASRSLNGSMQLNDWQRVYVDTYYWDTLVALNVYQLPNGRVLYQVEYGSYGDTKRIVPPVVPPFIQFAEPSYTFKQPVNPKNFTWGYHDASAQTSTNVTVLRVNPYSPITHVDIYNNIIPGNFHYVARSTSCRILYEAITQTYNLFRYDPSNVQATTGYPLTDDIAGLTITPSDVWHASERCDKFAVKNRIYYFSGTQFDSVTNNLTDFDWKSIDSNLNYIVIAGNVWKYNETQHKFVQYSTNSGIYVNSAIHNIQNRVLITAKNSTTAPFDTQVIAFIDEKSALTRIFNYQAIFDTDPIFDVSELLTKVVISGKKGSTATVDAYSIDYLKRTHSIILFPMSTIKDLVKTSIRIFEQYIYVRQIYDPSQSFNKSYTSTNQQEFAYYLSQDYLPQLLLQRNLTVEQAGTWVKSLIVTDDGFDYHIATESLEQIQSKWNVVVRLTELDAKQAQLTNGNNQAISGYVINNTIILCSPGCSDCSTLVCTGCKAGFTYKVNSQLCLPCLPGCSFCDSADPTKCSSCLNGTYLSGTSCLPCDSDCVTCSGSATSCLTCRAGSFFSSGECVLCPRNCLTCSSALVCTQCNKGFVVTAAGTCRGCAISCSDCAPSNITQCTACDKGLQLSDSQCIQCPANCLECNSGNCQKCIPGYSPNDASICVQACHLPCATCVDNQPTVCTSCYNSAALDNGTCSISLSCNSTGTCADCGQGLGYFLLDLYCYPCSQITSIPNCIQCSQSNQMTCSICKDGFYLDSVKTCTACPSACVNCVASTLCTSCQTGFTLPVDQPQGQCIQCQSPCATCFGTPTYCTTCVANFTKNGWKCQNDTRIILTVTLTGGSQAEVLDRIDTIVSTLLPMIGENSTNVDVITVLSVVAGSVIFTASVSPSGDLSVASSGLSAGLASSGSLGGLTISSSSVAVTNAPSSHHEPPPKTGLIVGLVVGLGVLAIILIVVVVCRSRQQTNNEAAATPTSTIDEGHVIKSSSGDTEYKLEKELEIIGQTEKAINH